MIKDYIYFTNIGIGEQNNYMATNIILIDHMILRGLVLLYSNKNREFKPKFYTFHLHI